MESYILIQNTLTDALVEAKKEGHFDEARKIVAERGSLRDHVDALQSLSVEELRNILRHRLDFLFEESYADAISLRSTAIRVVYTSTAFVAIFLNSLQDPDLLKIAFSAIFCAELLAHEFKHFIVKKVLKTKSDEEFLAEADKWVRIFVVREFLHSFFQEQDRQNSDNFNGTET